MIRRMLIGVVTALAIVGCSSQAEPVAESESAEQLSNTSKTPSATAVPDTSLSREHAAFLRSVEPCGLLDTSYLESLGNVAQLRPLGSFDTCSVELTDQPADQSVVPDQIDLTLSTTLPEDLPEFSIGDTTFFRDEFEAPSCTVYIPTNSDGNYARVVTSMADGSACTVAEAVADAAASGIRDGGSPRAGSDFDQPIASVDPCSVVEALTGDYVITDASSSPYACSLGTPDSDTSTVSIEVVLGLVAERAIAPSTDSGVVESAGRTFVSRPSARTCTVTYNVGDPVVGLPERNDTAAAFARIQPQLFVNAETCDDATDIAVAAAEELQI